MADLKEIEQNIKALEVEIQAEEAAQAATPVAEPAPAPRGSISPVIQLAIDQAAERLKRETGK